MREDLLGAAVVQAQPLVDQRDVVGDRVAVAGEDEAQRELARRPQRVDVVDQGAWALAASPGVAAAAGETSGFEEMWAAGGRRRSGSRARASRKTVSDGLWPGRWRTARRAVAQPSVVAVVQRAGDPAARAEGPERGPDRAEDGREVVGHAVPAHDRLRELVVGGRCWR